MPPARLCFLFFLPCFVHALSLDQKISLKLIDSLWQEGRYAQAEDEINRFLSHNEDSASDTTLSKLKADLLIKKKDFKQALQIIEKINDGSDFIKERRLLCLYELKSWDKFLESFESDSQLIKLPFGKKIWDLGLAEAIQAEQNIDKKKLLMEKASHLFSQDLKEEFDASKALSLALIQEEKKEYQQAFKLYEDLFCNTSDEAYQLSMARMASHFNPKKALQILEPLRWKSKIHGTSAAIFSMEILEKMQDFHELYNLSIQELKLAPEGYRKAKIALYHLKSLFYLKCFDRIPDFYSAYTPHKKLNAQDQILAVSLASKAFLIKNDTEKLQKLYSEFQNAQDIAAQTTAGRLLAKYYLEHKDYSQAKPILEDLLKIDVLHVDEYLTTLGICYLNAQAYETAESYFLKVCSQSPDKSLKKKSLDHLLGLPKLSEKSLNYLKDQGTSLDLKDNPKAVLWIVESLKAEKKTDEALSLLTTHGDIATANYHKTFGELVEHKNPSEAISHYQKALSLSEDDALKAYLHFKLFHTYFDHDKDKAADHLFQSFNYHAFSIPEPLFAGLTSYLYQKAFSGIKIYLKEDSSKLAASQLIRLFSYKSSLNESEKIVYGKTLRKLCRFEESEAILKNGQHFHQKIELAKVYNHLGKYSLCDQILNELIREKPYTLYFDGQLAFLAKICIDIERLKSQTEYKLTLEDIEKELRVLKVCIQDQKQPMAFEIELIKKLFILPNDDDFESLRFHPYFDNNDTGSARKILNFIINKRLDHQTALSIEEPLSETMEWILVQLFGKGS